MRTAISVTIKTLAEAISPRVPTSWGSLETASSMLCVWLLVVSTAAARDLFVNNETGNDAKNGHAAEHVDTATGPVRTIGRALHLAQKYDRVVVANTGKPYREPIALVRGKHEGDRFSPFVLEGNGATLEGSVPIPVEFWKSYGGDVFFFRPRRLNYPMLYLNGRPAQRVEADDQAEAPPKLEPLQWCLWRHDIYFRVERATFLNEYELAQPRWDTGITLYQNDGVVVANFIVQGFQLDGIQAHGTRNARVIGTRARGNGRSGIAAAGAGRLVVDYCLIGNNGAAQVWADGHSQTRVIDSQLLENTAPPVVKASQHAKVEVSTSAEPEGE